MSVKIGEVWVDSGQVMIVDPCYLGDWKDDGLVDGKTEGTFDYSGACAVTLSVGAGQLDHGAVVSSTLCGDGSYPVYAEMEGNRVRSLTIRFDGGDESSQDYDEEE